MSRVKNEIGNKYGLLTVIERAGSMYNGKAAWLCQCECGKQIRTTGDSLRSGQTTTCGDTKHKVERMTKVGQSNLIDITGQRFGKLTAIQRKGSTDYGGTLWECKCDCGNLHTAEYSNLVRGHVQSCGCLKSKGEQKIQELLTIYQIEYKTQYTPQGWLLSTNYKPYYDFGIFRNDELVALLEYNGEQHRYFRTSGNSWNTEENFLKTQRRDKEKQELCEQHNIPLYIIWYDEDIEESLFTILRELNFDLNKDF